MVCHSERAFWRGRISILFAPARAIQQTNVVSIMICLMSTQDSSLRSE